MRNYVPSTKVLVIGGGIGGLTLALSLKKAGIPCAVYEARDYGQGIGAGFNIAPNGMHILGTLGLAEKVIARGSVVKEHWFRSVKGKVIAHMRNGKPERYTQPGVSLSRTAVYEVLTDEIREQGVEIHYSKKLSGITDEGLQVIAHFTDGSTAAGAVLVGADGIHSRTRALTFPEAPQPVYSGFVGMGGFVATESIPTVTSVDEHSITYIPGSVGFFGYTGAGEGQMMWWCNLEAEKPFPDYAVGEVAPAAICPALLERFSDYPSPVSDLIRESGRAFRLNDLSLERLPAWHSGKVLLIGDAAHAVPSSSGQGASLALEDALYLAQLFRDCQESYASVFAQFERVRRGRVDKIIAQGRRKRVRKKAVSPYQERIGLWLMKVFIGIFGESALDRNYRYTVEF